MLANSAAQQYLKQLECLSFLLYHPEYIALVSVAISSPHSKLTSTGPGVTPANEVQSDKRKDLLSCISFYN